MSLKTRQIIILKECLFGDYIKKNVSEAVVDLENATSQNASRSAAWPDMRERISGYRRMREKFRC